MRSRQELFGIASGFFGGVTLMFLPSFATAPHPTVAHLLVAVLATVAGVAAIVAMRLLRGWSPRILRHSLLSRSRLLAGWVTLLLPLYAYLAWQRLPVSDLCFDLLAFGVIAYMVDTRRQSRKWRVF